MKNTFTIAPLMAVLSVLVLICGLKGWGRKATKPNQQLGVFSLTQNFMTYLLKLSLLMLLAFTGLPGWGQVNISSGNTVSENFNTIGATATATLPTAWKVDAQSTTRTLGTYSSAGTTTTQTIGPSMSSTATSGIYNYGSGNNNTGTDRAVGGLSASTSNRTINLYVDLFNNGASTIGSYAISYNVEKYRTGTLAMTVQMYYSTDGTTWTSAGSNFATSPTVDAAVANGPTTVPILSTSVTSQSLAVSTTASSHLYLMWSYSATSGTSGANAQALGIDDITIVASSLSNTNYFLQSGADPSLAASWGPNPDGSGGPVATNTTNAVWNVTENANTTTANWSAGWTLGTGSSILVKAGTTFNIAGTLTMGGQQITAAGASATVSTTSNAIIQTTNSAGLSGSTSTTISSTNSPTVTTTSGTVEYNGSGAQTITSGTYNNLTTSTGGTKTLGGTVTVTSILTVDAASTLSGGTQTLNLAGNGTPLVVNGTFTAATSTVNYSNASSTNITAANYYSLNTTGGDRVLPGGTVGVAGSFTPGAGNFIVTGNTFLLNGTSVTNTIGVPTVLSGNNFNILTTSGSGATNNLSSSLTTIRIGALNVSAGTLVLNTTTTVKTFVLGSVNLQGGTLDNNTSTQSGLVSTLQVSGNYIQANAAIHTTSGAGVSLLQFNGGSTSAYSGTTTTANFLYTRIQVSNNTTLSLSTDLYINGFGSGTSLTIDAGSTLNAGTNLVRVNNSSNTYSISGTVQTSNLNGLSGSTTATFVSTNTPTLTLVAGSTIEYNAASGTQVVTPRSDYRNVIISGGGTKTLAGATIVAGNFTISSGTFSLTGTNTLSLAGHWNNAGTFTSNSSTVTFNGTAAQTYTRTGAGTFNNLTLNNATGLTLSNDLTVGGVLNITSGSLALNGTTLALNGTVSGTGALRGSSSSNITLGGTGALGTLNFDQTTDGTTNAINNFTMNRASGTASLGNKMVLLNAYTPTAGVLASGGFLYLRSTSTNTARIGQGSSNYITGEVTVERFIQVPIAADRAYRTIAPSVNTTSGTKPSIRDNWQEGVNNADKTNNVQGNNGILYGTHITGTGADNGTDGLDPTQSGARSLYTYTSTGYVPIINTANTVLDAKTGYLLFIRGDRSDISRINATASFSNTTLRATGTLLTGPITYNLNAGDNKFTLITNPYASPIGWDKINPPLSPIANLSQFYTYVDPHAGSGQGVYVTVKNDGTNSTGTSATVDIQSGQAFFVQGLTSPPTTLTITEAHKSTVNNRNVFRTGSQEQLSVGLYFDLNGTNRVADGVNVLFNNNYSAEVDGNDAEQIANFDEDISINRGGKFLAIEGRPLVDQFDTISLNMIRMKVRDYHFEFLPAGFNAPGLQAFLQDKFLGTETSISLIEQTNVNFTVSSTTGSAAADRFRIVFKNITVLPINFTLVKAFEKGNAIQVEWNLGNESSLKQYEIEKSADGRTFTKVSTQTKRAQLSTESYNWLDASPITGNNYYRIKAIEQNGDYKYSQVVNVKVGKGNSAITIYPNPVKGNAINLQMVNQPKGQYNISLTNAAGQQVYQKLFEHAGGSASTVLQLNNRLAKGIYQLQISSDTNKATYKVVSE